MNGRIIRNSVVAYRWRSAVSYGKPATIICRVVLNIIIGDYQIGAVNNHAPSTSGPITRDSVAAYGPRTLVKKAYSTPWCIGLVVLNGIVRNCNVRSNYVYTTTPVICGTVVSDSIVIDCYRRRFLNVNTAPSPMQSPILDNKTINGNVVDRNYSNNTVYASSIDDGVIHVGLPCGSAIWRIAPVKAHMPHNIYVLTVRTCSHENIIGSWIGLS